MVVGLVGLWALLWCGVRQPVLLSALLGDSTVEFDTDLPRAVPERLRRDVVFLTETIGPRHAEAPTGLDGAAGLDRAAEHIATAFLEAGAEVERQTYAAFDRQYHNLIARFGHGASKLVVGAHYDAYGLFGENPGADDNASGTAALLELARMLSEHPLPGGVVIELVAFSTEEPPFLGSQWMGSAVYVDQAMARGETIELMICLEMIGYFTSDRQPWPNNLMRLLGPRRGDFVAAVGRFEERRALSRFKSAFRGSSTLPIASFMIPGELTGLDASDHRSFWQRGIPAILVTDTAFVRNPNYHTPNDRHDTLDYTSMAGVVDGVFGFAVQPKPVDRGRPR